MARRYIKQTCPKCKGTGYISLSKFLVPETTADTQVDYRAETCPKCGGKGWVETKLFIEEE